MCRLCEVDVASSLGSSQAVGARIDCKRGDNVWQATEDMMAENEKADVEGAGEGRK